MSVPNPPKPCKLVFGLLFREDESKVSVIRSLADLFGPLDAVTRPQDFAFTRFYEKEMGPGLRRLFGSFDTLVEPDLLVPIKAQTNRLEQDTARGGQRTVNVDPGLLCEERLVLATGKNAGHRIYLRDGIYADLTLIYRDGAYRPLPWTYPDYAQDETRRFFGLLRGILIARRSGRIPRWTHPTEDF